MSITLTSEDYRDLQQRLTRLESKLIRGFEEIGVDTYASHDWLSVDDPHSTLYIATMGRSLQVINETAKKQGATVGKVYELVWRGDVKGTIQIY